MTTLLSVRDLSVRFGGSEGGVAAVDSVSFDLAAGQSLGLVGESGSGKTTIARAILNLLPRTATATGEVVYDDRPLLGAGDRLLRALRWQEIAVIPQAAMNSLDPVRTVESQFAEVVRLHERVSRAAARDRVAQALEAVGIDPRRGKAYPHQFSGGMRQRALIALASILQPRLLIADEPTTGLDVIVQDQVLATLERIRDEQGLALLLVTHDLGVVAEICDRVVVMCKGVGVEHGPVDDVLVTPQHEYTRRLVEAAQHRPRRTETESVPANAGGVQADVRRS